jgi:type III secretory pathway component EscR
VVDAMLTILETVPPLSAVEADQFGISQARTLFETAGAPLVDFLRLNASAGEIDYFSGLAGEVAVAEPGMRILLPAFTVGEVTEAFVIGVLIYIPFVVIELIVSMTLVALGMPMLSPTAISLPLKLLLFVSVDGWHVLLNGLLVTYST